MLPLTSPFSCYVMVQPWSLSLEGMCRIQLIAAYERSNIQKSDSGNLPRSSDCMHCVEVVISV
jgi:hypothetical protein